MGHDNNHIIEESEGRGESGGEGGGGDGVVKEEEEEVKGAPENYCANSYVVSTNTYLSPFS